MPRKEPPSNPPEAPEKQEKKEKKRSEATPKPSKEASSAKPSKVRAAKAPAKAGPKVDAKVDAKVTSETARAKPLAVVSQARPPRATEPRAAEPPRTPQLGLTLARRWEQAVEALSTRVSADDLLETLALTLALDVQGGLAKASLRQKDALRRVGSAALLRMGPGLEEEFPGLSLAREGLRRLTQRPEAPRAPHTTPGLPAITDAELRAFRRGAGDAFHLAEIALRVAHSTEAQRMLAMLDQLETPVALSGPSLAHGLRLAAESVGAPIRNPNDGRRVAELTLGQHAVELYRFADGVLAAYTEPTVVVHLGGIGITRRQGRMGYAEALVGPEGDRVELEVANERVTLELGIPSSSQFPPPRG